ncbi:pantoate--beta-alanine ligase [Candidatus Puniceispirillum marinum]|uniref:Pantothenate synthetase n=1 Tax=Puniceispirillum marinum (strain IMCC1322) TaxID=488538 RepID=D5BTJ6_PUNMI|nr:pantoate--beta-alanine ligase [Candidatus Puniceispirillum marinum]ADE39593.1 pantoate-beta-alanine ligase [Candidatus Puniceispirillum marinum IMCC1322]
MTQLITDKPTLASLLMQWRQQGESSALVPTMGSIHAGHLALIQTANSLADHVIVTIFVNPTQFAADEDFDLYPRTLDADMAAIRSAGGTDVVFAPQSMYAPDHATNIIPGGVALDLETKHRPHFFMGVATIVMKLFMQVPTDIAIFGEKDYQQLAVIRQMVRDLDVPVDIISHPTVREFDGLALSSRNSYLSPDQRKLAPQLYATLCDVAGNILEGNDPLALIDTATKSLLDAGFDKIDYFDLRDGNSLAPVQAYEPENRLLIAALLGETRLIDNIALGSHA